MRTMRRVEDDSAETCACEKRILGLRLKRFLVLCWPDACVAATWARDAAEPAPLPEPTGTPPRGAPPSPAPRADGAAVGRFLTAARPLRTPLPA